MPGLGDRVLKLHLDRGYDRDAGARAGSSTRNMTDTMAVTPCVITNHLARFIAQASPSVVGGRSVPNATVPRTLPCLLCSMDVRGSGCHVTLTLSMSQATRGYILETSQRRVEIHYARCMLLHAWNAGE